MKSKIFLYVLSFLSHLFFIFLILIFFLPFAKWYFTKTPALGIDLYNNTTYVTYLSKYLTWPFWSWKYIWYAGNPLFKDYPNLYYYFIVPLVRYWSPVQATQIFCLISTFLFFAFSYLLFFKLSSSRLLAFFLTVGAIFSVGFYGALVTGGSLIYYISQAFLPVVLFFVVLYNKSGNIKFLIISSILTAISLLGHPQVPSGIIIPLAIILILFWQQEDRPFFAFKKKIFATIVFIAVAFFAAFPTTYYYGRSAPAGLFNLFAKGSSIAQNPSSEPTYKQSQEIQQVYKILTWDHTLFFVLGLAVTILFFIGLVFSKKTRLRFGQFLVAFLSSIFGFLFIFLYALRLNPFHGGWYRAFWFVPVILGLSISILWGGFSAFLKDKLPKILSHSLTILFTLLFVFISTVFVFKEAGITNFSGYSNLGRIRNLPEEIFNEFSKKVLFVSIPSSAFPDVFNNNLTRESQQKVYDQLKPSWLDPKDKNFRFYSADAEVNIAWNALYDMPLARGYIDPEVPPQAAGLLFLVGTSLNNNELIHIFKYPKEVANNYAKFILDWLSIKYFESPDENVSGRYYNNPASTFVQSKEVIKRDEKIDSDTSVYLGEGLMMNKTQIMDERLHYYEVKDELVSPILSTTNAKTLCIVSNDEGYGLIMRILAMRNINSQTLIPVWCAQKVSDLNYSDLKNFDSLLLYDYKSGSQKAWNDIQKYVEGGGHLIIDVGGEPKEAKANSLPEVFPIDNTDRKSLGQNWDFQIADSPLTKDIDFGKFDPAIEDTKPWNFSFPKDGNVKSWAKPLVSSWGKPLVIEGSLGKGQVIFSGVNLPYHLLRKQNIDEAHFFENLLQLGDQKPQKTDFEINWVSPEKREIKGENAKGILFKEHDFDGWKAQIIADGKTENLKIYQAGPRMPGFLYVIAPQNFQNKQFKVTFTYHGLLLAKFSYLVALITFLIALDLIVLSGRGSRRLSHHTGRLTKKARKKTSIWWEKEEA